MRPLRLQMNGFAAFRDEAVVDFTDADFFVLVGATGSGKSTVIDALTFALYGTVPRWNHRSMVMYGLAPTANQGKVALVFDVDDARYLVARELRRTKAGVSVRNARLERLLDPTALGEVDDATESIASDSGVTPAVEKLLGLPFEHFCQCVVLPQGEFADFLRAKPAERRTILLKLLGAGLYGEMSQRANGRAGLAGQRADLLADQLDGLADATEAAEAEAAQRESGLAALVDRVGQEVPRLRSAARALESAQEALTRVLAERDVLAAIAVPAQIAALDAAHAAAASAVSTADAAEAAARRADRAARDRLAAAPDRRPLDQALRDHAELARVGAALPEAQAAARAAAHRLTRSITDAGTVSSALEQARSARDVARGTVTDLGAQVERLTTEIDLLAAVVVPDGLVELAGRTSDAARHVATTAQALQAAQDRETRAQDAVATGPDRGPVEHTLRLILELADAERALAPLEREHSGAAEALNAARAAVADAERARDAARTAREHASVTHRAAALRSELVAGRACPVCDQVVATLPAAVDAPELAAADEAVRKLDGTVGAARTKEAKASAAETETTTRLATARHQIGVLAERLADRPRDPEAARRTLAEIDALEAAQRAASAEVRALRADHDAAVAAARALEAAATQARSALGAARDPLVVIGAPTIEETDLLGAWTSLARWAGREVDSRRARHRAQQLAFGAAEEAYAKARDGLTAAEGRAGAAQRAVNDATASAERAKAELDGLQHRISELTTALAQAPGVEAATEHLRRIDEMTAAVADADRALAAATDERAKAVAALDALTTRVGRAWRELRTVRDGVIGLDAPDLTEGSVLAGWTILATWAAAAARSRALAVPDAQDAVTAATRHRDEAAKHLTDEFAALGVPVGGGLSGNLGGDLADTAPAAAAAALAQARADRRRIAERRARAAAVGADLAKAQEEQQVAKMLGNLLRSNQFPEWLESAALDTLVVDASKRLSELSGGQFELTHRDGEFMVVDHADADSVRSVRTLSGGETFQASLALALALSTQLSSMAAEGAARLDSIFLDEGFGTLDDATLEVVAATLENLAQGDRMVGVVTHVGALADRIPVRFLVRRDSRTSSIEREVP
jgi:exonuclease SbcC